MKPRAAEGLPGQLIAPMGDILTLLLNEDAAELLPAISDGGEGTIERI